ncbi:MAG: cytochrome C [Deltaproteobacteria bacterium]|nr:MAG: cytochrome C [Deltaproteobacteria bacterium]
MGNRTLAVIVSYAVVSAFLSTLEAFAGIAGGPHDFSQQGWSGGSVCVVCHTPHGADTSVANAPLWNHRLSSQTYTLYASATLTATDVGQPTGSSKLCLSCHDGSVALDSFGGTDGSTFMQGSKVVGAGADLSDDHPISFVYDSALASQDGELHDPSNHSSGLGGTIEQDLLENRRLECGSCHDVHDGDAANHLLRVSLAGSMLCLTCHDK